MTTILPRITKAIMREDNLIARCNDLVTERNRAQSNADKLAEELRQVLKHGSAGNENHIKAALAAYEETKQ